MDHLPTPRAVEPEVVEPEIVGFELRPPLVLFGLGLVLLAAVLLFGGGQMRTMTFRIGR